MERFARLQKEMLRHKDGIRVPFDYNFTYATRGIGQVKEKI